MELDWDSEKIFRLYVCDYMIKKGMHKAAEIFKNEGDVSQSPVVLDSPDGFLHEWWSIFYEIFKSRQVKDQGTEPESSSKEVPKTTYNASHSAPPRIPEASMSEQRPEQCQVKYSLNKMMAQPAICLIPSTKNAKEHLGYSMGDAGPSLLDIINASNLKFSTGTTSNHLPQDLDKQVQNQFLKDSGIGIHKGRDIPRDPRELIQRTMQHLDEPHETNTNEGPNPVLLNGWPVNVGDGNQVLTSLLREPNYQQQWQVLSTQNQEEVFAQVRVCTPKSQTVTVPGNSSKCNSHHTKIPKTESSKRDRQMMDQMIRDHQPQMPSQNDVEKSRKRKTTVSLRPGESAPVDCHTLKETGNLFIPTQDHVDAADGKPVEENVESFLSFENEHPDHRVVPFSNLKRISSTPSKNDNKGFSFEEVGCLHSSKSKVLSTHFSSDGKVLASAGHEKKVFIWNMETFDCVTTTEEHSHLITDVRFRPGSSIFATSSFDRTIKLWDAARPTKSLLHLTGHTEQVMSLDFHPRKVELLCSCDSNDVIRLWNVNQCVCMQSTRGGGSKQVRFQPRIGKFLATASGNNIKIVDVETNRLLYHLKGHVKDVLSICWDASGNYLASVSEDSALVWSVVTDGKCISELHSNGNKFRSCIFHPGYHNLLVIGSYQSLELWCPTESSKTWTVPAHKGLIAGLADSPQDELIASASHDHCVKLWK